MKSQELVTTMAQQFTELFIKDLESIEDGKESQTWGGATRSAIAIAAECVAFIQQSTATLDQPQIAFTKEGYEQADAEITSREIAIKRLREENDQFIQKVNGFTDEQMNEVINTPWGSPTKRGQFAALVAGHTFYHDGQLNYIQTLAGDDQMHWM